VSILVRKDKIATTLMRVEPLKAWSNLKHVQ